MELVTYGVAAGYDVTLLAGGSIGFSSQPQEILLQTQKEFTKDSSSMFDATLKDNLDTVVSLEGDIQVRGYDITDKDAEARETIERSAEYAGWQIRVNENNILVVVGKRKASQNPFAVPVKPVIDS